MPSFKKLPGRTNEPRIRPAEQGTDCDPVLKMHPRSISSMTTLKLRFADARVVWNSNSSFTGVRTVRRSSGSGASGPTDAYRSVTPLPWGAFVLFHIRDDIKEWSDPVYSLMIGLVGPIARRRPP